MPLPAPALRPLPGHSSQGRATRAWCRGAGPLPAPAFRLSHSKTQLVRRNTVTLHHAFEPFNLSRSLRPPTPLLLASRASWSSILPSPARLAANCSRCARAWLTAVPIMMPFASLLQAVLLLPPPWRRCRPAPAARRSRVAVGCVTSSWSLSFLRAEFLLSTLTLVGQFGVGIRRQYNLYGLPDNLPSDHRQVRVRVK